MKQLLHLFVVAAVMLLLPRIIPGMVVTGWGPALLAALVLAVLNVLVKPLLFVITLPFTLLTLGLFLLVLNGIVLWLVSLCVPGFVFRTFGAAFLAALVLSVVGVLWKSLTRDEGRRQAA
jgi:putative membrane protein